ncbi:MAG: oligosaccharide flippase family protein [Rhodopirellula sp.]|nr:oligosaccharide flippase family protein [Rhodopirellula sp.]
MPKSEAVSVSPDRLKPAAAVRTPAAEVPLKALSLRRNFSWALVGNGVFAVCQWGVLAVLAKMLGATDVGRFALALAVTAPVISLVNLNLRSILATDTRRESEFGHYVALRLAGTGLAFAILPLLCWIAGYGVPMTALILIVGLGKVSDALNDIAFGLVELHERLDRSSRARAFTGVVSIGAMTVALWLSGSLLWGAVGWSFAHIATLLASPFWIGKDIFAEDNPGLPGGEIKASLLAMMPQWDIRHLTQLVRLGLPLGAVMLLGSLSINMPRYAIEEYLGSEELGIYSGMVYLLMIVQMVVLALGSAATPRLAKHYAAGDLASFWGVLGRMLALAATAGAVAVVVAAVAGPTLLTWLYTPEFAEYPDVLIWVAAVAGIDFIGTFLGVAMTSMRRFRPQLPLMLIFLTVTTVLCYWLVPSYGLMGAVVGSGGGMFCRLVGAAWVVWSGTHRT